MASIVEERVGALESTLPSNNTRIGDLETQLASNSSKVNVAAVELKSRERRLCFAEDGVSIIWDMFKVNGLSFAR